MDQRVRDENEKAISALLDTTVNVCVGNNDCDSSSWGESLFVCFCDGAFAGVSPPFATVGLRSVGWAGIKRAPRKVSSRRSGS